MERCGRCRKPALTDSVFCADCKAEVGRRVADERLRQVREGVPASTVQSDSPVVNRYRDAYRVGWALVSLGNAIKIVGVVLAGIIFLGSLSLANGQFGGAAVVAGLVLGGLAGGLFWVCGVIVAALGEVLRATLDTAVASSHFFTDPERADAMGLPRDVAESAGTAIGRSASRRRGTPTWSLRRAPASRSCSPGYSPTPHIFRLFVPRVRSRVMCRYGRCGHEVRTAADGFCAPGSIRAAWPSRRISSWADQETAGADCVLFFAHGSN